MLLILEENYVDFIYFVFIDDTYTFLVGIIIIIGYCLIAEILRNEVSR